MRNICSSCKGKVSQKDLQLLETVMRRELEKAGVVLSPGQLSVMKFDCLKEGEYDYQATISLKMKRTSTGDDLAHKVRVYLDEIATGEGVIHGLPYDKATSSYRWTLTVG